MNRSVRIISTDDFYDLEEMGITPHIKNMPRPHGSMKNRAVRPRSDQPPAPILQPPSEKEEEQFHMSYKASRYEGVWLEQSLDSFFTQKWFDDVLRVVKGGKEASVYLCQGNATTGEAYLAAKVYRPRMFRNLRNDWRYREGRTNKDEDGRGIRNKGMLHAIEKRTEYGRDLLHTAWLVHEYQTLSTLNAAGVDVPKPFSNNQNTILMSYYGDEVMGAPTLNEVSLSHAEARTLFERVVHNIDLMLSHGAIHGDLSAFNILYWEGEIVLIDFPQAVSPEENRGAYSIFERDVVRVCEYFQRQGVHTNPRKLAADLWQKHNRRFVPLVDPKALGEEDHDDERDIWETLKNA